MHLILVRVNSIGMVYTIQALNDDETLITLKDTDKSLTVHYPLVMISQSWFEWTVHNRVIQDAFRYLSIVEREFLMTGITPEDWDEIFKGINEEEEEK
jgi:hypothetical protein